MTNHTPPIDFERIRQDRLATGEVRPIKQAEQGEVGTGYEEARSSTRLARQFGTSRLARHLNKVMRGKSAGARNGALSISPRAISIKTSRRDQASRFLFPESAAASYISAMCNNYSQLNGQSEIAAFARAMRDSTGNLPPMPGIFPDYLAPVVRNAPDGACELAMLRWGMPGPPQFGGAPITNIRNVKSPHWRGWLAPKNRCVVPFTSFCEYADTKPRKTPTWFAAWPIEARELIHSAVEAKKLELLAKLVPTSDLVNRHV